MVRWNFVDRARGLLSRFRPRTRAVPSGAAYTVRGLCGVAEDVLHRGPAGSTAWLLAQETRGPVAAIIAD